MGLTDPEDPTGYVTDLLNLGRLGQRLCAVATECELATFLTPAAHDSATCSLLKLAQAERLLTYVFAFGVPETSG